MNDQIISDHNKSWLKIYVWLSVFFWTMVIGVSITWNLRNQDQSMRDIALSEARAYLNKDKAFRFWATSHGGVYVPSNEQTPPSPYLAHVIDRDIVTPSGTRLTLMNPSYAVRQMNEDFTQLYGIAGHITSLKPIRPQNAPDNWERAALMGFHGGKKEVAEFTETDGEPHLRLMGPLIADEQCLKCHANEGYQVAEIMGGVGVAVPMARLMAAKQQQATAAILGHVGIWFLGLLGIGLGTRQVSCRMKVEQQAALLKYKNKRMTDELNVAHEIQMSMLPLEFPAFPDRKEFSIHAKLEPAREVGGDFYDFYFIDDDHLCFTIGDVSDKGVPSALLMAETTALVKSRAANDYSTASILTHVNDELSRDNKACMFVTIVTGILNVKTGDLVYTNAGHNPPYIRRVDGTIERLEERHGLVVGAMDGVTYQEKSLKLSQGDTLVLYTDGVTEAEDLEGELFGEERLQMLLTSSGWEEVKAIADGIYESAKEFEGGKEQRDDITTMAISFNGTVSGQKDSRITLTLANDLKELERATDEFETFAKARELPIEYIQRINVILDEAISNIVSYAYKDKEHHELMVEVEHLGARLVVTITDDGIPFNPLNMEAPDTSAEVNEREVGGLGIHIVKSLVDEISYHRKKDKNVLKLEKKLTKQ